MLEEKRCVSCGQKQMGLDLGEKIFICGGCQTRISEEAGKRAGWATRWDWYAHPPEPKSRGPKVSVFATPRNEPVLLRLFRSEHGVDRVFLEFVHWGRDRLLTFAAQLQSTGRPLPLITARGKQGDLNSKDKQRLAISGIIWTEIESDKSEELYFPFAWKQSP